MSGAGTPVADTMAIRELRKWVWWQTYEAACQDLQSSAPELADPPEATRVIGCHPRSLEGRVKPD
eukprot:7708531-Alexandrium_andersonii.AAC.1